MSESENAICDNLSKKDKMGKIMSKQLLTYMIVSFGFSWSLATVMWRMGGLSMKGAGVLLFIYMCGPGFAGLVCAWRFNAGEQQEALGFKGGGNLWLFWAWIIGVALVAFALGISLLSPDVGLRPPIEGVKEVVASQGMDIGSQLDIPGMNIILILSTILLGAAMNIPLMLSEELGWRGWLWHHFRPHGFWTATFWIGLLWGLWHIPIIAMGYNYPGMPLGGPVLFTVFCMLYAPIFSYLREKNGSVWAPCVLHGTGNACAGLAIMMQTNADMPWRGLIGIGGFIGMIILTLWVASRVNVNKAVTIPD